MIVLHRLRSLLRWLFRRKNVEQELHDELQTFVELSAAENIKAGLSPEEARRRAQLDLRGVEQTKERVRTRRWGAWVDEIAQDVRYALRGYLRNPGLTIAILLTLALGIGANTAIFSLTDALMLQWLPVDKPEELMQLKMRPADAKEPFDTFSYDIVRAIAGQSRIFDGVAGFSGAMTFNVGLSGNMSKIPVTMVTGGYYKTLGLKPALGRLLNEEDDKKDSPPIAVISYGYWERQFAQQAGVLGQTVLLNGMPVTIVGVSAKGFTSPNVGQTSDITLPIAALPHVNPKAASLLGPGNFWLRMLARPSEGMSIASVQAYLASVWPGLAEQVISPRWSPDRRKAMAAASFVLMAGGTGWTPLRAMYKKPLAVLSAIVGLVLLIACFNIAGLQLARGFSRQRETAVRLAIGAGRGRLIRQFLIESTLLSFIASLFGVGLAWVSSTVLVNMIMPAFPISLDLTPNLHVLGFTALIAIATGILFGVLPALQISRGDASSVLNEVARIAGTRSRLIPGLVTLQVAVSLVLLIAASLFIRTLQNLQNLDMGFGHDGVLLVTFEDAAKFRNELVDEIRGISGVVSASISTNTPLSGGLWTEPAVPAGQSLPQRDTAIFIGAGPRYFETLLTPLVSGRGFSERDSADSAPVAVISEALARRYFAGTNPVGQYISTTARVGPVEPGKARNVEVVGVAKDTVAAGLRRDAYPAVYVPYVQLKGTFPLTLEVRISGSLTASASALRAFLQPRLPDTVIEVRPLSIQVEGAMAQERVMATFAGAFAVLALMLACIGLYGLLAYDVARRTKEIGIRMSLGAHQKTVIANIVKSAAWLLLLGVVVAVPAAWAASRWVQSLLFGIKATDPVAIGEAVLLMMLVGFAAAYIPARRASRIDPLEALRHE
jgi:putative ABC transport system permease protein